MIEMILGFIFTGLILIAMSIGVIMGRKPIKGSCGGVGAALGEDDYICEICGGDSAKCDNPDQVRNFEKSDLAYEAATRD